MVSRDVTLQFEWRSLFGNQTVWLVTSVDVPFQWQSSLVEESVPKETLATWSSQVTNLPFCLFPHKLTLKSPYPAF